MKVGPGWQLKQRRNLQATSTNEGDFPQTRASQQKAGRLIDIVLYGDDDRKRVATSSAGAHSGVDHDTTESRLPLTRQATHDGRSLRRAAASQWLRRLGHAGHGCQLER